MEDLIPEEEAHILRGLLKALDALDEVIALIRRSPTADEARSALMDFLDIDEAQAQAISEYAASSSGGSGTPEDSGSPRRAAAPHFGIQCDYCL